MEDRNRRTEDNFNDSRHLYRLHELDDYKVASEDPDVRGWEILDRDNDRFGTVKELIVDPEQERVRYLDVEPSKDVRSKTGDERMLIPIGVARLDQDNNKVIVNEVDKDVLGSIPLYTGDRVTRDYEIDVVEKFNRPVGTGVATPVAGDFYNAPLYDETRFYTNRTGNRNV